jgi:DNA topoisomerase-1
MKKLIIVESPTKARTIGRYVSDDFNIIATMGHLRDLPKSKFGVEIEKKNGGYKFIPTYTIAKKKQKYSSKLKKAAEGVDEIYLAPDPDREGEAIAWHTRKILKDDKKLKLKDSNFKRVTFHEITKNAITTAMENPGKIDMDLVDAQQARRILDRLVGYSLSPLLWKKIRRGLSAGRVQSVAVRLIVEREREIEKFKQEQFYKIWVGFGLNRANEENSGSGFVAKLAKVDGDSILIHEKTKLFAGTHISTKTIFDTPEKAEEVIQDLTPEFEITKVSKKDKSRQPFPPYTTSYLQQDAAYKFHWSAKYTMSIAQSLFENGYITYHRTDSTALNKGAIFATRKVIKDKYGDKYLPKSPRMYKTKSKTAQEAHEAIRPTNVSAKLKVKSEKLNAKEKKLYELIWKRTVACQMAPAKLAKTKVNLINGKYLFIARGSQVKFDGFTKVYPVKLSENLLPELKEGQKISSDTFGITEHETRPPARYSEASLIAELEDNGIGRPSTYAPIISTIRTRNYVDKENRRFIPTVIGTVTTDFLVEYFKEIMSLKFTADMENSLDDIATGEKDWQPVLSVFWSPFYQKVDKVEEKAKRVKMPVEKTGKKCPKCGKGELIIRVGKYGKFLACDRFPDCKYTADFNKKAGFECPKCGADVVIKKTKKGAKFYSCSRWPDCDWSSWKKPKREKNKE